MNSTNVPSSDNQINSMSDLRVIEIGLILDRENSKDYKSESVSNGRAWMADYIAKNPIESDLSVGNATLGEDGILRTENKSIPMKSQDAYRRVKSNNERRNKLKDDKEVTKITSIKRKSIGIDR